MGIWQPPLSFAGSHLLLASPHLSPLLTPFPHPCNHQEWYSQLWILCVLLYCRDTLEEIYVCSNWDTLIHVPCELLKPWVRLCLGIIRRFGLDSHFSLSHHAFYACPSTFLISPFCWCWCWDDLLKRIFHHIPGFGRPRFGLVGECVTALDPGHALLSIVVIMWSQSFFFLPLLLLYSIDWVVLTSGGIWRLLAGVQLPLYLSVWALAPSTSWPLSLGVLHFFQHSIKLLLAIEDSKHHPWLLAGSLEGIWRTLELLRQQSW